MPLGKANSIRVMEDKTMEEKQKTDIRCAFSINRCLFLPRIENSP